MSNMPKVVAKIESHTTPGKFYNISELQPGVYSCNCAGFGYRRHCSHLEQYEIESFKTADASRG